MKLLFVTDLHVNVKTFNHLTSTGYPARMSELVSTFNWLKDLCSKHSVDRVFFGGDLFDRVFDLKLPFFNLAFKGFYQLNLPADLVDGNHDKFDSIYRVMDPFKSFARVHSLPESYYDTNVGIRLAFIPFQRTVEDFEKALKSVTKEQEDTLLFIHQGVKGRVIDELAVDKRIFDIPHVRKVFAGHYHFKFEETLGGDSTRIVYPGSGISLHFDDNLSTKYVVLYDTKTGELTWEENPYTAFFVSLKQNQIEEMKDKLEQIASYSYLQVVLGDDETLNLDMSYLLKFRGYSISTGKRRPQLYQKDRDDTGFDYKAFSSLLSQTGHASYELSFEQFQDLVVSSNEDASLVKKTTKEILSDILKEAYLLGTV